MNKTTIYLFILFGVAFTACDNQSKVSVDFSTLSEEDQRKAENALASMETAEGVNVQLFASEPMVANLTNMAIDARGRIWVCEGRNYRNQHNPDNPYSAEGDRILILEDTDGDGVADKTKVFYQGEDINAALGIAVLGSHVIVSISPNVFIFTDEDGDDVPDSKEVMFSGIGGVQHDHGAHSFSFGADGRLYFNMGNEGKQLLTANGDTVQDKFGKPVVTNGKPLRQGVIFRCEMDGSNVEPLAWNFRNPYEVAVDANGSLWQSDNDDDGNQAVRINFIMEYGNYGFTDELSGAGWRARRTGMHNEIPKRHWYLNDPGVVPNLLQTGSGSPTGILVYESADMLPEVFHNQMIHAEPGHQVVRAYVREKDGAGYKAEIVNLLKSEDPWFRPSDVTVAPDGSVFVADWYDAGVGGHKAADIQRGRIYRISTGGKYKSSALNLTSAAGAAQALLSPNQDVFYQGWVTLHSMGPNAEEALAGLVKQGGVAKARALWLLARIKGRTSHYIKLALDDQNEDIRVQALRMARYLDRENLINYLALVTDDTPQVRREALIALRHTGNDEDAAAIWADLAAKHQAGDRWHLEALGIGSDLNPDVYFIDWLDKYEEMVNTPAGQEIIWRSRSVESTRLLAEMIANKEVSVEKIPSYIRAMYFKPVAGRDKYLAGLLNIDHPQSSTISALALGMISADYISANPQVMQTVRKILPDIAGSFEWLDAIRSMKITVYNDQLLEVMVNHEDNQIKNEAVSVLLAVGGAADLRKFIDQLENDADKRNIFQQLGSVNDGSVVALLSDYVLAANMSYPLMVQVVESMGNTWDGQHLLYDLLKENKVPEEYKTTAVLKLMNCWDPEVSGNAPKYLPAANVKDGGQLASIDELVEIPGAAENGKNVFDMYCKACHVVNGEGIDFGPGLSEIGSKLSREAMISSVIFPSAGINFGYEGYHIKTNDNKEYYGFIASRTESEITLKMMGGVTQIIAHDNLASMEAMGKSLMTENLQMVMSQQELVDLVEYMTTLKAAE
ncbi:MAG: PQQ-dependent sugar dehydrogenase [Cyclobacteriaceae bacterium]|nr:PQQ-dependent sugar dehydrogenase [Cyclobacteriaceae bacterium]